jgi:hypothetical protein
MRTIIASRLGSEIGMNIDHPTKIEAVHIREIHDSYFVVVRDRDKNTYFIPFHSVVKSIENENGVVADGLFHHKTSWSLVIRLGTVVNFVS